MPVEYTKNYKRERIISPKRCARGSFRIKSISKKTKLVICCPKGKWTGSRCKVGTIAQSKMTKR